MSVCIPDTVYAKETKKTESEAKADNKKLEKSTDTKKSEPNKGNKRIF